MIVVQTTRKSSKFTPFSSYLKRACEMELYAIQCENFHRGLSLLIVHLSLCNKISLMCTSHMGIFAGSGCRYERVRGEPSAFWVWGPHNAFYAEGMLMKTCARIAKSVVVSKRITIAIGP